MRLPLKVFISSKEHELDDERKAARFVIASLGLEFLGSEERPPSGSSMEDTNTEEVMNSDIYVGIFGKIHSPPTISEFITARGNEIPVLVFWKTEGNKKRHKKLSDFYETVKDPQDGIVFNTFGNLSEFQRKLARALQWNITDRIRRARKLLQHNIPNVEMSKITPKLQMDKKGGERELGAGKVLSFQIPQTLKKGKELEVSVKIRVSARYIFADLLIVAPDKRNYWFPDLLSWNAALKELDILMMRSTLILGILRYPRLAQTANSSRSWESMRIHYICQHGIGG